MISKNPNEDGMSWWEKIIFSFKNPGSLEIITFIGVIVIIAFRFADHQDQRRFPASSPAGNDQFLTSKIYNYDGGSYP